MVNPRNNTAPGAGAEVFRNTGCPSRVLILADAKTQE